MHYLISGHTGFNGAWLVMLLKSRGHEVSGFSLDPLKGSLFAEAGVGKLLLGDYRQDIRDFEGTKKIFQNANPDVFIHLAAQPLVLESYKDPVTTYETNVNGTLNVLRGAQEATSIRAQIIVTTDKVYKNENKKRAFSEEDALAGSDPYSASKAMADILTQSWIKSSQNAPTAIARAGNVIGGGDVSPDRLLPDLVLSLINNVKPKLRNPSSVRPWQHVLDCLNGYTMLVDELYKGNGIGAWNFGPSDEDYRTVGELAQLVLTAWGKDPHWLQDERTYSAESDYLTLDSSKARTALKWHDKWNFNESVIRTANWYKLVYEGESKFELSRRDIAEFRDEEIVP